MSAEPIRDVEAGVPPHTPLPWRAEWDHPENSCVHIYSDGSCLSVVTVFATSFTADGRAERDATARFIVRAVNAHEDLLAVAQRLEQWMGQIHERGGQIGNLDMRIVDELRAALARAEGRAS